MKNKKFYTALVVLCFAFILPAHAQTDSVSVDSIAVETLGQDFPLANERPARRVSKADLSKRASDHLLLQLGYITWSGAKGLEKPASKFNREFNIAFMIDKPFKSNPKISVGLGLGYSSGNVFFNKVDWGLKEAPTSEGRIVITDMSTQNHFDKYKIVTQFVEAPVELRFSGNAQEPSKGFRVAAGIKFGYLMKSYTKGKNLMQGNADGTEGGSIYGKDYIVKEHEGSSYINNTRFMGTLRFGYGIFNIYGNYQINPLFKTGATQGNIRPFTIGIGLGIL